jgi:dihydrofolate reductase
MRKLIVSTNVTLDGQVDEVRDWGLPYDHPEFVEQITDLLGGSDGLVLGRRTYEFFAGLFPARAGDFPYVDQLNSMAKHVASTTLERLDWDNSHLIDGDVAEAVAELKRQPGRDLIVFASPTLMHGLLGHDLIDEYRLWVHPVVLGRGRPVFDDGVERMDLELVDATVIPPGVTILTLR